MATALAAPTVETALRGTGVSTQQERRMVDMRDEMYAYDPDASPFLVILSTRAPGRRAGNPTFKHLEDQPLPRWDTVAEDMDTTETGMDVAHGSYFTPGNLLFIATTGEYMRVISISTNTLTVIRALTGDQTTGVAFSSGAYIAILGNVVEEGAASLSIRTTQEAVVTNYCTIHKNSLGGTNTLAASDLYAGKDEPTQIVKAGVQHAFDLENLFLFSKKAKYTASYSGGGSQDEYTTGGLVSWLVSNATTVSGSLTDLVLETWAQTLFRYSRGTKLILASRLFATQLDMIAGSRLEVVPRADTYGVAVKRFVSAHGEMLIAIDDMLINDFSGWAIGVDMEKVEKRYMVDQHGARDSRLEKNIQTPDLDQWKHQYLSQVGLHVYQEACHGVLKGIT